MSFGFAANLLSCADTPDAAPQTVAMADTQPTGFHPPHYKISSVLKPIYYKKCFHEVRYNTRDTEQPSTMNEMFLQDLRRHRFL